MTQFTDPVRWTASPGDAPDVLRDVFQAGGREAPAPAQMRALSLKLAAAVAAGAGAAAAGGAVAKPIAATLGGGSVKSVLAGAKLFAAMTMAGAVTIGSAVAYRKVNSEPTFQSGAAVSGQVEPAQPAAPAGEPAPSVRRIEGPSIAPVASPLAAIDPTGAAAVRGTTPMLAPIEISPSAPVLVPGSASGGSLKAQSATRASKSAAVRPADRTLPVAAPVPAKPSAKSASVENVEQPLTELGLLRQAQLALETRPREAFALTQKHRAAFPRGQFAEERDALAIQALLRAGERDEALDLAERFVAAHPNSAHSHQVRELLNSR